MIVDLSGTVLVVPIEVLFAVGGVVFRQPCAPASGEAADLPAAASQPPPALPPPPPHRPFVPPLDDDARPPGEGELQQATRADCWPPRFATLGTRILCNGAELDLEQRPLTYRLFAAFCASGGLGLSLGEIVARVYCIDPRTSDGLHYTDRTYGRSVRLLSRARSLAKRHLSAHLPEGVEWFVYNQTRRRWQLCALVCEPGGGTAALASAQA